MSAVNAFHHVYSPTTGATYTVLLLHGTGGDEHDLLQLGRTVAPGANLLSPRGKVLENGMPRFFRRLAEGVFDFEDVKHRTTELADWIRIAAAHYKLDRMRLFALGYSNGANIAASLLLLAPDVLAGGVLLRAMVPLKESDWPSEPVCNGKSVLIASGRNDPIATPPNAEMLASIFRLAGANLDLRYRDAGHPLVQEDVSGAQEWFSRR